MKAIDKLLEFMQRHQLTSVDYATYDRARRLYDHNPVRHREWIDILAESKTDQRIVVRRGVLGTSLEAASLSA
ncbi:hypothetical protein HMPREF2965_02310 [Lactobacillus sp. HMSC075D02]|jgi:hypothetical protein|uniref:hypothetical protein n=1 Tax=Lacticaseibacillus TaxID=2759736 RepID=UPI00066984A1|nr:MULTISPECIES: hypothetical protein [Lacticaseibacillus]OFP99645.1 hypothetical protein HMPREF2965_02310 [Lactobacillus sp. HMSC075D02]RNE16754.1 hypothetical protein FAM3257_03123 [Lacticaseibacillus paracasei]TLQ33717.1 hypothetical protein FEZ40_16295 [Lacticaseibacillus paracasei]